MQRIKQGIVVVGVWMDMEVRSLSLRWTLFLPFHYLLFSPTVLYSGSSIISTHLDFMFYSVRYWSLSGTYL